MKNDSSNTSSVLIIAGEASSALYAKRILELWKEQGRDISAFGVGDVEMEELGFDVLGRSEEMAVVGFQEVISNIGLVYSCFNRVVAECKKRKPKVALLLDYPGFNLRLAKKLKQMGIPVVYYISPQVWAWKTSRVKDIKATVDKMLVLFPFEKDFYREHEVEAEFVGHPLLDELDDKYFSEQYHYEHRSRYGIKDGEVVLALMPGSRRSELKHHLQVQLDAAALINQKLPKVKLALFVAPTFSIDEMKAMLPPLDVPLMVIKDEPFEMLHLADVVLCASGTATLMVGLMERAMVIMYRMNSVTAWLAKRLVTNTKYFGMANLILDAEVSKELFQSEANPEGLTKALEPLLADKSKRSAAVKELKRLKQLLGDKGATRRVVEQLDPYLEG